MHAFDTLILVSSYISLILNIYVNWHIDIFAQIFREMCSDHFFFILYPVL